MAFGLPALGEGTWGQKLLDSINFLKSEQDGRLSDASLSATFASVIPISKYGAKGDGTTDETAAFNAAIAAANATLGDDRANITGITFDLGNGRYKLPTALDPITVSGVAFRGINARSTTLLMSANGPTFTYGDATGTRTPVGFEIADCKIEYPAAPTGGAIAVKVDHGYSVKLTDVDVVNIGTLVSAGVSSSRICGGLQLTNVSGSVANVGLPFVDLKFGAGLDMAGVHMFVAGVANPVHPAAMTTTAGTFMLACNTPGGSWDTVQIADNCTFERFDIGVHGYANSGAVYQNFFIDAVFDYCKRMAYYAEALAGGTVATWRLRGWAMSWEESTVVIKGAGTNDYHDVDLIIPISGKSALDYSTTTAKVNRFRLSVGANTRAAALAGAVNFAAGSTGFSLTESSGNRDESANGTPWRNDWGVFVGANCDAFQVTGNDFTGAAGGYNTFAAHSAGSKKRLMKDNLSPSYAYGQTLTPAASGSPNVNTTAHAWEVAIFGGTVTAIAKEGTTITGMTSGKLHVGPGESFTLTYSAAPIVTLFPEG